MSSKCTGIHLAELVWSKAWNQGTNSVNASKYIVNEDCLRERTQTSTNTSIVPVQLLCTETSV